MLPVHERLLGRARSIAFPALLTGVFGYPLAAVTQVAVTAVRSEAFRKHALCRVHVVLSDDSARAIFKQALRA
ncbi:MAG: hypothetical protein WCB49_07130 [Gammaproteobacteria bacterium]